MIAIGVGLSIYSGYECAKSYQHQHSIDWSNINTIVGILGVALLCIGIILLCRSRHQDENHLERMFVSDNETSNTKQFSV
jgi:Co/Zn/Cd efflux system component